MILVTGSILARAENVEQILALSLEHVKRSRAEPGCRSHAVHRDVENPLRLVFVEEWESKEALAAHFAVPASREFSKKAGALAAERPNLNVYSVTPVGLG